MKKHRFIVLALVFMLLFAAVSCNQEPEIKADPLDETKQAIPAENVDMSSEKDFQALSKEKQESFRASLDTAIEQFSKGIIAKALASEEGMSLGEMLNEYFGYKPSAASEPVGTGTSIKVFESLKGTVTAKAKKIVYETNAEDEFDRETIPVSDLTATATLSKERITVIVNGTIYGEDLHFSLEYVIEDNGETGDPELLEGDADTFNKINDATIMQVSGLTIEADGVEMSMNIPVSDYVKGTIQVKATIEGKASIKATSSTEALIKVDTLKISASVDQVANLDATIKGLSLSASKDASADMEFSGLSISEVSLSGAFLPSRDNIRFKANVNGFEIFTSGTIAIDSVDASIMGYGVVSVAASINDFSINTKNYDSTLEFTFGAAASIGNQTIGLRGGIFGSITTLDFDVTLLNGEPITMDSLITFIMEYISSISPSAAL